MSRTRNDAKQPFPRATTPKRKDSNSAIKTVLDATSTIQPNYKRFTLPKTKKNSICSCCACRDSNFHTENSSVLIEDKNPLIFQFFGRDFEITMSPKNNKNKKYEVMNNISDNGDSIYALPIDQVTGGQIYVSEDKIRDIVQDELAKRFGKNKEVEI